MTQEAVEQTQEESNAAFEAGFSGGRNSAPVPVEKEAPAEQAPEEKPAEVAPAQEPDLKAEVASLREKVSVLDKLPEQLRNIHGHIGNLNSQLKTALAGAAKAVEGTGKEAPTQQQVESASQSSLKWKQLKEDFPDWADALDERFAAIQAAMPKAFDPASLRTELDSSMTKRLDEATTRARQFAFVDFKHPEWESVVKTPEFAAWMGRQAPDVQALANSPHGKDAVRMLDAFAADHAKSVKDKQQKEANQNRLRAATTPEGRPAPLDKPIDEDAAFEGGFKSIRGGA